MKWGRRQFIIAWRTAKGQRAGLSMLGFGLAAAAATHKGPVRERNEDFHLLDLDLGLVVVSDGMGGHRDGDIASRTATHVFRARIEETAWNVEEPEAAVRPVE